MTSRRHDQAAALRTSGSTESSSETRVAGMRPSLVATAGHPRRTPSTARLRRYPEPRVLRRAGRCRPRGPRTPGTREVLVGPLGGDRSRADRARGRGHAGVGPARQGVDEPAVGELVVGAGGGRGGDVVDAQLRADPANPAALGRGGGPPVALRGGVLCGQRAEHDDAGRPGALGHLRVPPATQLGRLAGGGLLAAGDVGRASGGGPGPAGPRGRIPVGRQEQSVLAAVHPGRLRRPAAAGPGGGDPAGADRRHRGQGAGLGQLGARQATRDGPGEVARNPRSAGVGEPEPARTGGGVQLVVLQLGRRRRMPGLRRLRRRAASRPWPD